MAAENSLLLSANKTSPDSQVNALFPIFNLNFLYWHHKCFHITKVYYNAQWRRNNRLLKRNRYGKHTIITCHIHNHYLYQCVLLHFFACLPPHLSLFHTQTHSVCPLFNTHIHTSTSCNVWRRSCVCDLQCACVWGR